MQEYPGKSMSEIRLINNHLGAAFLLAYLPACSADDFGKLLTTPQEREIIRQWRSMDKSSAATQAEPGSQTSQQGRHQIIRFDGMLLHHDGSASLWVNGRLIHSGDKTRVAGFLLVTDPQKGLGIILEDQGIAEAARIVYIKPGQSYDHHTGEITDYQHAGIKLRR